MIFLTHILRFFGLEKKAIHFPPSTQFLFASCCLFVAYVCQQCDTLICVTRQGLSWFLSTTNTEFTSEICVSFRIIDQDFAFDHT